MAYALGAILILVGIVLYAAIETWFELRHNRKTASTSKRDLVSR
jgi:hypothetical protein